MAETIGWGGTFSLHNGTILTPLTTVTGVGFPEDQIDEHETTVLNATGRRKTYIAGLIDGGTFNVMMNYVGGGTDDVLCLATKNSGATRAFKIVVPGPDGTPLRMFTGSGFVKSYKINEMRANDVMTSELTLRVTGAVTEAVAA